MATLDCNLLPTIASSTLGTKSFEWNERSDGRAVDTDGRVLWEYGRVSMSTHFRCNVNFLHDNQWTDLISGSADEPNRGGACNVHDDHNEFLLGVWRRLPLSYSGNGLKAILHVLQRSTAWRQQRIGESYAYLRI